MPVRSGLAEIILGPLLVGGLLLVFFRLEGVFVHRRRKSRPSVSFLGAFPTDPSSRTLDDRLWPPSGF